jgi:hypothetical protein
MESVKMSPGFPKKTKTMQLVLLQILFDHYLMLNSNLNPLYSFDYLIKEHYPDKGKVLTMSLTDYPK